MPKKKPKNFVRFVDMVSFQPVVTQEIKDFYATPGSTGQPLRIKIAATHAGKITRNNGFYLPHKMRDGAHSFVSQYKKPIQIHHDSEKDPVGRVVAATYVDISQGIRKTLDAKAVQDEVRPMSDAILDAFCQGKLTEREAIEVADRYFIKDSSIVDDPDYQGLGYIELVADITDPDAKQKILDGRYLTGSVGASTNSAVCSICKADWAGEDGPCDHRPGKIYDSSKCVLIAGDLHYDEYSFVNKPADTHSSVIEVNIGGMKDSVTIENDSPKGIPEVTLVVDHAPESTNKDSQEESSMEKEIQTPPVSETPPVEDQAPVQDAPVQDNAVDADPIKAFFGTEYDELVGDDLEEGRAYAEMIYDAMNSGDAELVELLKDKKLNAKARKALPSSVFCKPPRGYPVNDCGHAKSAMAYAKKYNEASSVMACIRRKAARLGCPFKDEVVEDKIDPGKYTVEFFDTMDDDEVLQMYHGLVAVLADRQLDCPECNEAKIQELENALKDAQAKAATATQDEVANLHKDVENLSNMLADAQAQLRNSKVETITQLRKLSDRAAEVTQIVDELKDKPVDVLDEILKDLSGKVDIDKIADRLNSGLGNINPEGAVQDPTQISDKQPTDKKPEDQKHEINVDKKQLEKITEQYLTLRMSRGQRVADAYLADMKAKGVLPKDLPVIEG